MADEEDDASKTEDPTERKLSKARDKGQVAVSQEVKHWGILLGGTLGMLVMAPGIMGDIRRIGARFIESPEAVPVDLPHIRLLAARLMEQLGLTLAPLLVLLVAVAFFASVGQTGLLFSPEKIKPDPGKVSLVQGAKKRFSMFTLVEFLKGILKITVVAVVAFGLALPLVADLRLLPLIDLTSTLHRIHRIALWLMIGTVAVMTVIAVLDFAYQKFSFLKRMRMSKQEIKDEHRQSEGDPQVKARIRKIRAERAQQRMMAAVPKADVVITNPTHYAVALEYKMENMAAPKVVAKGVDSLALRIRGVAEENDVPVVENPPLARALYATVDLDEEIPDEHYKAVAEVIGYVMRLRGDLPPEARPVRQP